MRIITLLLFLFFLKTCILLSQKHYFPGYIISQVNDTIHGKIKDRKPWPYAKLYKNIRFKSDSNLFRKKLSPDKIKGYHVNQRTYESIGISSSSFIFKTTYTINSHFKHSFLRIVSKGQLSYYLWEYFDSDAQIIESIPLLYKRGDQEMVRATQGIFGLKRKLLSNYFNECAELAEKIETKEIKTIEEILKFYNTWYVKNNNF